MSEGNKNWIGHIFWGSLAGLSMLFTINCGAILFHYFNLQFLLKQHGASELDPYTSISQMMQFGPIVLADLQILIVFGVLSMCSGGLFFFALKQFSQVGKQFENLAE